MDPNRPVVTALQRGRCPSIPELAARYLEESLEKILRAVDGLDDDRLWRSAPGTNSIANLLIHLAGNLGLWIGHGLGGGPADRDRAGEFTAHRSMSGQEAVRLLTEAIEEATIVLRDEDPERLIEPVEIQGYSVDRLGVQVHALEHLGYHAGQIVLLAKQLRGPDHGLDFYPQHRGE